MSEGISLFYAPARFSLIAYIQIRLWTGENLHIRPVSQNKPDQIKALPVAARQKLTLPLSNKRWLNGWQIQSLAIWSAAATQVGFCSMAHCVLGSARMSKQRRKG